MTKEIVDQYKKTITWSTIENRHRRNNDERERKHRQCKMSNKDPIKSMGDSGAPEIYAIPVPFVMPTMLLNIMTKFHKIRLKGREEIVQQQCKQNRESSVK